MKISEEIKHRKREISGLKEQASGQRLLARHATHPDQQRMALQLAEALQSAADLKEKTLGQLEKERYAASSPATHLLP